jgi:type I restriction enzyme S subunit
MKKGGKLEGWKVEKLKSITTKIGSGATPLGGEKAYKSEGVSLIRSLNVHDMGFRMKDLAFLDDKQADKLSNVTVESGDVLLNITGASVARCCIVPDDVLPARVNQHVSIIRLVKDEMSPEFLHYALISNEYKDSLLKTGEKGGSTRQAITKAQIEDFSIKYPPLPEQQRIVHVLDEAFASIAQAKSNTERNLVNARELFESYLQEAFAKKGDGWEEKSFEEICVLQRGFDLPKQSRTQGVHPLVSSNGITDRLDVWKVKAPGVATGRSGTIGNVHYIEEDYWPLNTALYVKDFHGNNEKFVYYFLKQFDLGKYSSGAGVPTLNRNNVHSVKVYFPKSLAEQRAIVGRLEALSAETGRLEEIYQSKVDGLEELKRSVLGKAFGGEL